jgi:hypothetical protein
MSADATNRIATGFCANAIYIRALRVPRRSRSTLASLRNRGTSDEDPEVSEARCLGAIQRLFHCEQDDNNARSSQCIVDPILLDLPAAAQLRRTEVSRNDTIHCEHLAASTRSRQFTGPASKQAGPQHTVHERSRCQDGTATTCYKFPERSEPAVPRRCGASPGDCNPRCSHVRETSVSPTRPKAATGSDCPRRKRGQHA